MLFAVSVLLHELGHAIVALRNGIEITDITLWLFGGVARMGREADSAGTEFRIAAAGPAVTFVIAAALTAVGIGLAGSKHGFLQAMLVENDADISGPLAAVAWLASINILVLLFNLIPAFPLDGGRIIRAAWRFTGDRNRATRFAARLGQLFSYVFVGVGLLMAFGGNFVGGVWLALIGLVLGGSARASAAQSNFSERIGGLSVADVMDAEPVAIPDDDVAGSDRLSAADDLAADPSGLILERRLDGDRPGEDREPEFDDRVDIPHRAVDHQPGDPPLLGGEGQDVAPGTALGESLRVDHEHVAGRRLDQGVVDDQVVLGNTVHRQGDAREPTGRIDRLEPGIERPGLALRLVEGGRPQTLQNLDLTLRGPHRFVPVHPQPPR